MMMFVSAVKNLNLDGKTEKANALDHIAPVVLEIMRIAMKKVQANGLIFILFHAKVLRCL